MRRLPGRIVGETVDSNDRRAFVTTLRAREQDIRREKATSNVCTNQTLMAVTAAIQLVWLGTQGLREIATRCAQGAHYLFDELVAIDGVTPSHDSRSFASSRCVSARPAEGVLDDGRPRRARRRRGRRVDRGRDLSIEGDHDDVLLVTVTERRTQRRNRPIRRVPCERRSSQ